MLIVGPSNNGKSMIAERFRRMHPPLESSDGSRQCIPVLVMQMPAAPSIRRFYAASLPPWGRRSHPTVQLISANSCALRIMRLTRLRLLIIDELHNLLSGKASQQREFLNLLRFLGNELRVPLALSGQPKKLIWRSARTTSWRIGSSRFHCRVGMMAPTSAGSWPASRHRCRCGNRRG